MSRIPRITPATFKTEEIRSGLINPGSASFYLPHEAGPRIVYLDPRFSYPETPSFHSDAQAERQTQRQIWQEVEQAGAFKFLDRIEEEQCGPDAVHPVRARIYEELGTRSTAEFYERVFSELLDTRMDVVAIATGIRQFDGENYHEIGYLDR